MLVGANVSSTTHCIVKNNPRDCEVMVRTSASNSYNTCKTTTVNFVDNLPNYNQLTGANMIFAITPTYVRHTQKVDLTSLCQTIMHVKNLLWIVVEDSESKTPLVFNLLKRCRVRSVQLNIWTSPENKNIARGVEQRNLGLSWIRHFCTKVKYCSGSVYFMDDDNKYDLRLFEEVIKT